MGIMQKGHIAWDATRIWERLWVGGLADAEVLAAGNPHGIATVISLSEFPAEAHCKGVNYLHFPFHDGLPIPVRKFDAILDAIEENIRWGTVLLHCSVGVSRAPSLAASWMATVGYKNLNAAVDEIRRVRPLIDPSKILLDSIRRHLQ